MTNPLHNLYRAKHDTVWLMHYTVHPTPFTKERIRVSLGTRNVEVAKRRRDAILARPKVARTRQRAAIAA